MTDIETQIAFVGGPILAIVIFFAGVRKAELRAAKEAGVKAQKDAELEKGLTAAHTKIREDVMPRIEALENARAQDMIKLENFAATQAETKEAVNGRMLQVSIFIPCCLSAQPIQFRTYASFR